MTPPRVPTGNPLPRPRPWLLALVTLGLCAGGVVGRPSSATAATVRAANETLGAARQAGHAPGACRCGMNCGETCCCAPLAPRTGRTVAAPATPPPPYAASDPPRGPCLSASPCGGGAVPSSRPTVNQTLEPAALAGLGPAQPESGGERLAPTGADPIPERMAPPLDDPPEPAPR